MRALRHTAACMEAGDPLPWALCYTAVEGDSAPHHARFVMTDHVASGQVTQQQHNHHT